MASGLTGPVWHLLRLKWDCTGLTRCQVETRPKHGQGGWRPERAEPRGMVGPAESSRTPSATVRRRTLVDRPNDHDYTGAASEPRGNTLGPGAACAVLGKQAGADVVRPHRPARATASSIRETNMDAADTASLEDAVVQDVGAVRGAWSARPCDRIQP